MSNAEKDGTAATAAGAGKSRRVKAEPRRREVVKRNEMPDLITEEAKDRIGTLAREIDAGVKAGTMDETTIASKTTAMIEDIFADWKDSLIPDDIIDPTKYPTPSNGNPIDTLLQQDQ